MKSAFTLFALIMVGAAMGMFSSEATAAGTWTFCAKEGGTCSFSGTAQVQYGADGKYVTKTFTGGTPCTNAVFGDPIFGVVKSCEYLAPTTTTTPTPAPTSNRGICTPATCSAQPKNCGTIVDGCSGCWCGGKLQCEKCQTKNPCSVPTVCTGASVHNAAWINEDLTPAIAKFMVDHKIFHIYWQTALIGRNGLYNKSPSNAAIQSAIQAAKAVDPRVRVYFWPAVNGDVLPNVADPAQRKMLYTQIVDTVKLGFDGSATDLESSPDGWVEYINEEAVALHAIGKISAPFLWGGSGLWIGNYNALMEDVKRVKVDYYVAWVDGGPNAGEWSDKERPGDPGWVPAVLGVLENSPSPVVLAIGYQNLVNNLKWIDDMVKANGWHPKLAGFALYAYGSCGRVECDDIYPSEWSAWAAWKLKD